MQTVLEPDEKRSERVDNQSSWPTENDQKLSGKMTLVVKSKKVCIESRVLSLPTFDGRFGSTITTREERVMVYADVLDDAQNEALKNARTLASILGIAARSQGYLETW